MITFLKSQLTSIVATAVDFAVSIAGVTFFGLAYGVASGTGNLAGAITGFSLNRRWTFSIKKDNVWIQAGRYVLVWCGYFALNVMLVTAITMYTSINYIIVKIGVAIVLSAGYNYGLYKKYVFR